MKRPLKKLVTSLVGTSVIGTCLLGASVSIGSVSSSAIASETRVKSDSVELASGLNYELLEITCETNRATYYISIASDDTHYYYRSGGLNIPARIQDENDPNAFRFYNNDFEYEVLPVPRSNNRGTATINVYKYGERLMSLRSCNVVYPF
ncbi:hypothetical protein HC928_10275 [bacterium]|nr:hypothetical protein [bacterium]